MILIGIIQAFWTLSSGLMSGLGADFVLPPKISEVWQYMIGLLQNGKNIMCLFLDIAYMQHLVQFVIIAWSILVMAELISWVFRLIKLNF